MRRRAVILAGGLGTRLRPYTVVLPKPLMPIGEYPILEVIIRQLAAAGFLHVTLAVNHQAELLRAFFGTGDKFSLRLDYSLERKPLGTMGPLRLIEDLPDNFLVMNGDILTDLDLSRFFSEHETGGDILTISAARRVQRIDYGVLNTSGGELLTGFDEKPSIPYLVSMGIYSLSRRVLDFIPHDEAFGFDGLVLRLLAEKERVRVREHSGYWLDIGRPDDYARAIDDWPTLRKEFSFLESR